MRRVVDSVYATWVVLAFPAIWLLGQYALSVGKVDYLVWTGLLSGWLFILSLMVTPLRYLFGRMPWLKMRRRYFGVASFGYAVLHLYFWLINANIGSLIRSFYAFDMLTGWISFFIMIALAATSNELSLRTMGTSWKTLQRWAYPAAVLAYIHWLMTTAEVVQAVLYAAPLIALTVWRVLRRVNRSMDA